jgi:hypothetical protein
VFIVLSCGNKEDIKLSKSNVTVMADVKDHSPIYILFRTKGKDTLAEVNRKTTLLQLIGFSTSTSAFPCD